MKTVFSSVLVCIATVTISLLASADDIHVNPNPVTGARDGSDCEHGLMTIQEAVDQSSPGDRIILCAGTHQALVEIDGKRDLTILGEGAVISSAVGNTESVVQILNSRNILIDCEGPRGAGLDFILCVGADEGSALFIEDSRNITVQNCRFISNSANLRGGAVAIRESRDIRFINNTFFFNEAINSGGGAMLLADNGAHGLESESNLYSDNFTQRGPGGAILAVTSTAFFMDDTFQVNHTGNAPGDTFVVSGGRVVGGNPRGGAIFYQTSVGRLMTTDCTFNSNISGLDGGAVAITGLADWESNDDTFRC